MVNLQIALATIILSFPCSLLVILLTETLTRFATCLMQAHAQAHYNWPSGSIFSCHVTSTTEPTPFREFCNKKLRIKQHKSGTSGRTPHSDPVQCVVCLCEIVEGDEIRELKCRHLFHRSCLDTWLQHKRATCPICRDFLLSTGMEEDEEMEFLWVTSVRHGWTWMW